MIESFVYQTHNNCNRLKQTNMGTNSRIHNHTEKHDWLLEVHQDKCLVFLSPLYLPIARTKHDSVWARFQGSLKADKRKSFTVKNHSWETQKETIDWDGHHHAILNTAMHPGVLTLLLDLQEKGWEAILQWIERTKDIPSCWSIRLGFALYSQAEEGGVLGTEGWNWWNETATRWPLL